MEGFAPGEYKLDKVPPSSRLDREPKGKGHGPYRVPSNRIHIHQTEGIRTVLGSKMAAE